MDRDKDLASLLRGLPKPAALRDANEAKTRTVYIDRILHACGWLSKDLGFEEPSGTGDYLDYVLADERQQPWMVLEAKRSSRTFAIPKSKSAYRSIASLYKQSKDLKDVLDQAARYCNDRGIAYACATNGYQWMFFRGLSSSGRRWMQGTAYVFESFEDILARISEFVKCLGRGHAFTAALPDLLERGDSAKLLIERRPLDSMPSVSLPQQHPQAAARAATDHFFSDLYDDERMGMLDECYVIPGHSSEFDITLQRLLKDTTDDFIGLEDEPRDGTPSKFMDDLATDMRFNRVQHPIAVVGNVGAGKTTFLRRVLVDLVRTKSTIVAYLNLEGHSTGGALTQETEARHLTRSILRELQERTEILIRGRSDIPDGELPQADPRSRETLGTLFRQRIEQEWRLGERLYSSDVAAWDRKKLEIYDREMADEVSYLQAFIRHLKARIPPVVTAEAKERNERRRIQIVVFVDNLDQGTDEYQRFVYGYCAELIRNTGAIAVLCLRDDTYRAGRRSGGFLTSSQLHYVFHVASPPLDRVLKLRLEYGERRLEAKQLPGMLRGEEPAVQSALSVVRTVFGELQSDATSLVASLSGQDVRESLRLVRAVVQSVTECSVVPRPSSECVFECMAARFGTRMGTNMGSRPGVFNIFDAPPWLYPLHALPARLLAYLVRAYDHVSKVALERSERVICDFDQWGYPPAVVREVLLSLLRGRMIRSPELTKVEAETAETIPTRLVVTASGHAHLTRVLTLEWYRALAGLHMRWYDENALKDFVRRCVDAGGVRGTTIGDVVVSGAVSTLDAYLASSLAKEDANLAIAFDRKDWVRAVRSSAFIFQAELVEPMANIDAKNEPIVAPTRVNEEQMALWPEPKNSMPQPMPPITLDTEYGGSKWIPRILWALMHAERTNRGPMSAADIDRTLIEHAAINVHGTNVARAFRVLKQSVQELWTNMGKRYQLTDAGRRAFSAAFSGEEGSMP